MWSSESSRQFLLQAPGHAVAFTTKANHVSNIICEHCTSRKTSNAVAVDIASHAFAPKKSLEVIGSEQVGTPAVQVLSSPNQ